MRDATHKSTPINPLGGHKIILSPATRSLQRHSKRIRHRIHYDGGTTPLDTLRRSRGELALTKRMIRAHVESDTGKFFTNQWSRVETHRMAFHTIRRYTGLKARPRFAGSLFLNDSKDTMVSGAQASADAFADLFETNHELTHRMSSIDDGTVDATARILSRSNRRIIFCPNIPAEIPNDKELKRVNQLLPYSQRNLLSSAAEVIEIVEQRPNKKSSGNDDVPYPILRKLDPAILGFFSTFFNHLIANAYFPRHWRHANITV